MTNKIVVATHPVETLVDVRQDLRFQHEAYSLLAEFEERAARQPADVRVCDDLDESLLIADIFVLSSSVDYSLDRGRKLAKICRTLRHMVRRPNVSFLLVTFSRSAFDNALGGTFIADGLCVLNPTCDDVWKIVTADRETAASSP